MAEEIFESVINFLEKYGLMSTARVMRKELKNKQGIVLDIDKEKHLTDMIYRELKKSQIDRQKEIQEKKSKLQQRRKKKVPNTHMSNDEVEKVMEDFMNKVFVNPNLLEDEKLNQKIEMVFDNKLFQKMVENANVLEDAGINNSNSQIKGNDKGKVEEPFDIDKSLLDSKLIEKSELSQPYDPETEDRHDPLEKRKKPKTEQEKLDQQKKHDSEVPAAEKQAPRESSPIKPLNEKSLKNETEKIETFMKSEMDQLSEIEKTKNYDDSRFIQDESSSILTLVDDNVEVVDEYEDEDDPGFELYEVGEEDLEKVCVHLAKEYNFPDRAVKKGAKQKRKTGEKGVDIYRDLTDEEKEKGKKTGYIYLPETLKHPENNDSFYPVAHNKTIYDCFNLRVIYDRERTGFEETKEFPIVIGSVIAGRYQTMEYLGSAAFSKAIQCLDLRTGNHYCMKIIENNKDYFDQSIDEIKLLKFINCNGDVDEKNVLRIFDAFYHKEHLFLITELLKDNLYEYYKFNREKEDEFYFTLGRMQKITKQILEGLKYIHGLKLIHCDLKPENIMIKSYSRSEVKIIDFGSSCYIHDHLSSYVQSRSYRAPEVIIGCKYDYKIDIWSLGCILAELWTGNVLFQNDTVQGLLARVIGIIGPFPEWMMKEGRLVGKFFTEEKLLYQDVKKNKIFKFQVFLDEENGSVGGGSESSKKKVKTGKIQILVPKKSNLKSRLQTDDIFFLDFLQNMLHLDPHKRFSAEEALQHPWITQAEYELDG